MAKLYHPLLTLIASATDRELARYVQYLKEENRVLRARLGEQVHTKPEERRRLVHFGKGLGRAIEELITIVSPSTFYRWIREEKHGKKKANPFGSVGSAPGGNQVLTRPEKTNTYENRVLLQVSACHSKS